MEGSIFSAQKTALKISQKTQTSFLVSMKLTSREISGIFLIIFGSIFISLSLFGTDLIFDIPSVLIISAITLFVFFRRVTKKESN